MHHVRLEDVVRSTKEDLHITVCFGINRPVIMDRYIIVISAARVQHIEGFVHPPRQVPYGCQDLHMYKLSKAIYGSEDVPFTQPNT